MRCIKIGNQNEILAFLIKGKLMSTEDQYEVCSVCGGSGITRPVFQDMNEAEKNGGLEPLPIECQHCGGSGKDPE